MLDHGPHPPRSREKKEIRDVNTFTAQHVRAATRSIKCERQWRHVALATAGPMLLANNMVAYPLHISNSVCPLCISNTCLMSVHTIYNHVKSIICYLCFMQHAWSCFFFLYTWVRASWIEFNNCPTRCDLFSSLYFCRQLYMFQVLTPIIRCSYSCNYSFWCWLTAMNKICCY